MKQKVIIVFLFSMIFTLPIHGFEGAKESESFEKPSETEEQEHQTSTPPYYAGPTEYDQTDTTDSSPSTDPEGLYDANEKIQEILRTITSAKGLSQKELETTIIQATTILHDTMLTQIEAAMDPLTKNAVTKVAAHEYLAKLTVVKDDITRLQSRAGTKVGGLSESSGNVEELQYQNNIVAFVEATAELASGLKGSGYKPSFFTPEFISHMQNIYLIVEDSSRILQAKTITRVTPKKFKEIKNRAIVMNSHMQTMFKAMEESTFMKMAFGKDGYLKKVQTIWQDAFLHIQREERASLLDNGWTVFKALIHSTFVTIMYLLKVALYVIPYMILGTAAIVQSRHSEGQHVGSGTFTDLYQAAEESGRTIRPTSDYSSGGGLSVDPGMHDAPASSKGGVDDGREATDPQDLYSENSNINKILRDLGSRSKLSSKELEEAIKNATASMIAEGGTLDQVNKFLSDFIAKHPEADHGQALETFQKRLAVITEDINRLQTVAGKQVQIQEGQYLDNIVSLVESLNDFITATNSDIAPAMLRNMQTVYHTIEDAARVLQAKTVTRVAPAKIKEIKDRFMQLHQHLDDFHDRIKDSTFMQFAFGSDGYLTKVTDIWSDYKAALNDERNSTGTKIGKGIVATGYTALVTVMYILKAVLMILPYAIMGTAAIVHSFHNEPFHVTSGTWAHLQEKTTHPVDSPSIANPHPDTPVKPGASASSLFEGRGPQPGNPFVV